MPQAIDHKTYEQLLPLVYEWTKAQEQFILAEGAPLTTEQVADARRVGVQDCSRVRVLVVDRIPLPDNSELADAARRAQIITAASSGVAIGHAIMIRADRWGDRELLLHNLVHVAQCERVGGLKKWVYDYLCDRRSSPMFTCGVFEEEARRVAREICAEASSSVEGEALRVER